MSGECVSCGGKGAKILSNGHLIGCGVCGGTGARTDVGAIARRYGGDGTARLARFEVGR